MFSARFAKGLSIILALATASAASAQISQELDFETRPEPVTVAHGGVEVTVQPSKPDEYGSITTTLALRAPGVQSAIMQVGDDARSGYSRWIGFAKLNASDPLPSVLFESFSGGAHCCATLYAIVPYAGRFKLVEFAGIDGDISKRLPTDLDADGSVDFLRQDDSFRYQFSSGAGSYSPPAIFNVYKGQLIDVSVEPGFRPVYERFASQTLKACSDKSDEDRNGACAAYVAAGARLGRYEAAMKQASALANPSAQLPQFCQVTVTAEGCPSGKELTFYTFQSALSHFLRENGYIN